jgi:hypothetical protein
MASWEAARAGRQEEQEKEQLSHGEMVRAEGLGLGERVRADEEDVQREAHAHRKGRVLDCTGVTLALLSRWDQNGSNWGVHICLQFESS